MPGRRPRVVIVLSPAGLKAIEEAAPQHVASVRRHMIDLLTTDEIAALDSLSHRIVERLAAPE